MSNPFSESAEMIEEEKNAQDLQHVLNQLKKPEVQESLSILINNLPQLTKMTTSMLEVYETVSQLAGDRIFVEDIKSGFQDFISPIETGAKKYLSAAIEAKDRVEENITPNVGLFSLIKMMKDPQIQKMLKLSQAFLAVLSEKEQSN